MLIHCCSFGILCWSVEIPNSPARFVLGYVNFTMLLFASTACSQLSLLALPSSVKVINSISLGMDVCMCGIVFV